MQIIKNNHTTIWGSISALSELMRKQSAESPVVHSYCFLSLCLRIVTGMP